MKASDVRAMTPDQLKDELLKLNFNLDPTFTIYEASRDVMAQRTAEWHDGYTLPSLWGFYQPSREAHGSYWFDWTTRDEIECMRRAQHINELAKMTPIMGKFVSEQGQGVFQQIEKGGGGFQARKPWWRGGSWIGKAARADDAHPSRCAELCHFPADAARADNACGLVPEHNRIVRLMLEAVASLIPVAPMKTAREVEKSGQDILGHRAPVGEPA